MLASRGSLNSKQTISVFLGFLDLSNSIKFWPKPLIILHSQARIGQPRILLLNKTLVEAGIA